MSISKIGWALALGIATMLGGCGLNAPELQDFGDRDSQIVMVQSIVHNINCELRDAFHDIYEKRPNGTFMDNWGVRSCWIWMSPKKTSVAPSATWSPPPSPFVTFTLAGGISGSSQAEQLTSCIRFYGKELLRRAVVTRRAARRLYVDEAT